MENELFISIVLAVLGLLFGSFAGASVWRLRAYQLQRDAKNGEKVDVADKKEVAKLQNKSITEDRSVCLRCGHELKWYDLLPLVSWVGLRGKCRYCHKPIGWYEPAMEIGMATFFVISYIFWPLQLTSLLGVAQLIIWLVAAIGLLVLFVYDAKWFLLPNVITFPLIGLGLINAIIVISQSQFDYFVISNILFACIALSGFYYVIYVLSKKQWVGFGDVKLGLALALLLADWQLAILALFIGNLVGTLLFLPSMVTGKVKRQTHIPLGPLLIVGWAISGLFGAELLRIYTSFTLGV